MLGAEMFEAGFPDHPRAHPRLASRWRWFVKRAIDLTVALILGAATLPLMLVIAVAIRLESSGPAIFRQTRYGRHLKPFCILKFRTLRANMPDPTHKYEITSTDPRITHMGAFLRRTSLDELPQLWNVIRGDMSLIGPRPLVEWESRDCMTHHAERFLCLPGITGLSQVTIRNGGDLDERSDWDIEYTRTWSLLLDIEIMLRTPLVALRGMDVYVPSETPESSPPAELVVPRPLFAVRERKTLAGISVASPRNERSEQAYVE